MFSGRSSFAILLSVLLLVGQWPLSVMAELIPDNARRHCHSETTIEHRTAVDRAGDACHRDGGSDYYSQHCGCAQACTGCAATLAAVPIERFQPHPVKMLLAVSSVSDGFTSLPISPSERPPRFLLD